jgi:uncharacterized protein
MATPSSTPISQQPVRLVPPVAEPAASPAPNPALIGLASFLVGAVTIAMVQIGVVPATAVGASMPIVFAAAVGMWLSAIWAARLGESAAAGINSIVAGFLLSYGLLVMGLVHGWYGLAPTAVASTQKVFLIAWVAVVSVLIVSTLRLPRAFTLLFATVDVSLILGLLGVIQNSENLTKASGWVLLAVSAIVVYFFASSASEVTGGKEFPVGQPILHS